NEYDVEKMTADLDDAVVFRNIQNGQVNMHLEGIDAFRKQAEQAKSYFEIRQQEITSITHDKDTTSIEIDYSATLAIDLPGGLKKGDKLNLKGKSTFKFVEQRIVEILDIARVP